MRREGEWGRIKANEATRLDEGRGKEQRLGRMKIKRERMRGNKLSLVGLDGKEEDVSESEREQKK